MPITATSTAAAAATNSASYFGFPMAQQRLDGHPVEPLMGVWLISYVSGQVKCEEAAVPSYRPRALGT
jgi:hypothetical protein